MRAYVSIAYLDPSAGVSGTFALIDENDAVTLYSGFAAGPLARTTDVPTLVRDHIRSMVEDPTVEVVIL